MKSYWFVFLFMIFLPFVLVSQNTVGVLTYDAEKSFEGYNLLFPHNQSTVFLIDNCGQVVHRWTDIEEERPGGSVYLLENGDLLKAKKKYNSFNAPISGGGAGEIIEQRTWGNDLLWQFELNDSTARLHHDFAPMPNGNVLMIAWEVRSEVEALEAGRNPLLLSQGKLWPDFILEYNPTLEEIVWEWHAWDHLVQDFDQTKENFGIVNEHPELIDLNWDTTTDGHPDWMHINAIDYNPVLDQIALSVPRFNEVWIIDHSTTVTEAAEHSGGLSEKGGDLLYRWGNPIAYKNGLIEDQKLFFQHNITWVNPNAVFSDPDFNVMAVFNNRVETTGSTANIFSPDFDTLDFQYEFNTDQTYTPLDFDRTIAHPEDEVMASSASMSGVQILPNGNALLCSSRWGFAYEITPEDEVVWEYYTPLRAGGSVSQGDILSINDNVVFRLERYDPLYSAFVGRDLAPQGYLELNADEEYCDFLIPIDAFEYIQGLNIYPNPVNGFLKIEFLTFSSAVDLEVYDLNGRLMKTYNNIVSNSQLDVSFLSSGIYFVTDASKAWHYRFVKI